MHVGRPLEVILCQEAKADVPSVVQAVRQMDAINRQTDELARLRDALSDREAALAVAQADNAELQLRASTSKQHCIMFADAWIIETTHHRLKGTLPLDREGASLLALPGEASAFHADWRWMAVCLRILSVLIETFCSLMVSVD